jgi:plastocyanin
MTSTAKLLIVLTLAVLASALPPPTPAEQPASIVMARDFMFAPTALTVKAGSTVTWTNQDQEPHTVVSVDGLFRSGALDTNDSFSFKFERAGTYRYACSIHPQMIGTIVVQ